MDTFNNNPARDTYNREEYILSARRGGRIYGLQTLLLGQARLVAGPDTSLSYDEEWMYATLDAAIEAYLDWSVTDFAGEPAGWTRHMPGEERQRENER